MDKTTSSNSIYDTIIRLILLLGIIAWCFLIMLPFVNIILWSVILAIALHSLHEKLEKMLGGKPKLASLIIVLSLLLIFILPIWFLAGSLVEEFRALKASYDAGTLKFPVLDESVKSWPLVGPQIYDLWQSASVDLEKTVLKYQDTLLDVAKKLANGIANVVGGVVMIVGSLVIAGVILAIDRLSVSFNSFLRKVAGESGDELAAIIVKTVSSVANGVIGTALIVAVLNGLVFLFLSVPYAGLWAFLIFVLGLIQMPVIIITLPVVIYLFSVMDTMTAIIWTVVLMLAGLSDNVLKPILLGKNAVVPMPVVFIGVIGGFVLSGFIGLFTGAIVMSLGYKLFTEWMNTDETAVRE